MAKSLALLATAGISVILAASPICGLAPDGTRAQEPTLRETLERGLKARRPEEFQFIDRVVRLVDAGTLPKPLVEGTLIWARRQHNRRPFPYFQRGIRERARRIGVQV